MKTIIYNLYLTILKPTLGGIAVLILVSGCGANENLKSSTSEVEEGVDINKDPLSAIQKVVKLGENASNIQQEIANKEPVEPITFKELLKYLPQAPKGWQADKPKGETNSFGNYSITQVNQRYSRGDKKMTVSIFDWAFNSALYVPFLLTTEFSQESTEGYNKGIKIGNIPGREEYSYSSKQGTLNLLVNNRFFVQIEGNNIEDSELQEWWQLFDQKSLTKISKKQS
ncbi:hypothetical protein [Pleurocapsa sp. PCC 7319]|uniref:hypothetical protein n=1 Tax=Pleurocapsa sp. PCC 7319 TaxID=118161 RepID=UPI000344C7B7|nr:hypothetical protein [Pleurocapsa sp. PCC 7319]